MGTFVRRVRRRQEGAAAVEFALVLPVLILLVFGIMEFGLAFRDTLTLTSATRTGARTASALSRDPNFNNATLDAVTDAIGGLPEDSIEQLWIYKAGPDGYPVGRSNFSSGCSSCGIWNWSTSSHAFVPAGASAWDPYSQNACAGTSDSVGVYLKVNHEFVTQLFGSTVTLTDHTVMRLEPRSSVSACHP